MGHSPNGYLADDIGTVTGSYYDKDGFLAVTPDVYGEQKSGVQPYELHSQHGFGSRPHDPDPDGQGNIGPRGCTVRYSLEGSQGHAWLAGDPRVLERLPQFAKGSSWQYAAPIGQRPAFQVFDGDSGSFTLSVPYAFDQDGNPSKSMLLAFDVRTAGSESVSVMHGDGMGVTMTAGGSNSVVLRNKAGDAYVEVNDSGIVCNGTTQVNGSVAAGEMAAAQPVALAPSTLAAFAGAGTAFEAISGAIDGASGSFTGNATTDVPTIEALLVAIAQAATAGAAAIAAATPKITSLQMSTT